MNEYNSYAANEEMGWDDAIENDAPEFATVPPGDYPFTVTAFERARHPGSEKLPPCNKAVLAIRLNIPPEMGVCTIKHNLFLSKRTEGRLCEFFTAIGQRRHGERINMNWGQVVSSTGTCKVTMRKYTDKNGVERETNDIAKFYDPAERGGAAPTQSAPASAAGAGYTPKATTGGYGAGTVSSPTGGGNGANYIPGKF